MTIHHNFIGCDIGKEAVDIFDPRTARFCRIPNTEAQLSAFAKRLDPAGDLVVLEATGHCDRLVRLCLAQAGIAFARVNPKTARRFAEARGRLAKTDRIDARSLSHMGPCSTFRPMRRLARYASGWRPLPGAATSSSTPVRASADILARPSIRPCAPTSRP